MDTGKIGRMESVRIKLVNRFEMAFFGRSLASRKIEIDVDTVSSDCPELKKRLERIESNYMKLNNILSELEARFELDDRITNETEADEITKIRKKKPR